MLYDLARDPGETDNILLDGSHRIEAYRRDLTAHLDETQVYRSWKPGDVIIEDESICDRLRVLCYLQ